MNPLANWYTKDEAAKKLGRSVKTIERLADRKQIEQRMRPRIGGNDIAVFNPKEIDRLAQEMTALDPVIDPPPVPAVAQESTTALSPADSDITAAFDIRRFAEAIRVMDAQAVPLAQKPRVTLREAVALGFQAEDLRNRVKAGTLENVGTAHRYRFRRRDLDAL